jgi:hypothetical protein
LPSEDLALVRGLLEIYARVALTGIPEKFEMFINSLGLWYSVSAYSPEKGFFVAIFDVISKQMEDALRGCFNGNCVAGGLFGLVFKRSTLRAPRPAATAADIQ